MHIRLAIIGDGSRNQPYGVDLPTYADLIVDPTAGRAFADVPDIDVPADVAAFVRTNPTPDLIVPLLSPVPAALARSWREHLARRYDLGEARWKPEVA